MKLNKPLIMCVVGAVLCIALAGCEKAQSEKTAGAPTGVGTSAPGGGGGGTMMPPGGAPAPK